MTDFDEEGKDRGFLARRRLRTVNETTKERDGMIIIICVVIAVALMGLTICGVWLLLRSSLPQVEGQITVSGLKAPVRIDRDHQGVPSVHAENQEDLSFGLGFVHGQDRFFQMDSLRRYAAGELSELFGRGTDDQCIAWDKKIRLMRFRSVAGKVVAGLDEVSQAPA